MVVAWAQGVERIEGLVFCPLQVSLVPEFIGVGMPTAPLELGLAPVDENELRLKRSVFVEFIQKKKLLPKQRTIRVACEPRPPVIELVMRRGELGGRPAILPEPPLRRLLDLDEDRG